MLNYGTHSHQPSLTKLLTLYGLGAAHLTNTRDENGDLIDPIPITGRFLKERITETPLDLVFEINFKPCRHAQTT